MNRRVDHNDSKYTSADVNTSIPAIFIITLYSTVSLTVFLTIVNKRQLLFATEIIDRPSKYVYRVYF